MPYLQQSLQLTENTDIILSILQTINLLISNQSQQISKIPINIQVYIAQQGILPHVLQFAITIEPKPIRIEVALLVG